MLRFSIVMHLFDYSLLDRKNTFSISKKGNGRHLKVLEVLACTACEKRSVRDRAVFQSALAVFCFSRTKPKTRTLKICFNCAVKGRRLVCI